MPDEQDQTAAALLLENLREGAEADIDDEALSRVRKRLYSLKSPRVLHAASNKPSRWELGARGGVVAALLVGTALGAGGHALVSYVIYPQPVAPRVDPKRSEQPQVVSAPNPVLPLPEAPTPSLETPDVPPLSPPPSVTASARGASLPSAVSPTSSLEIELRELEAARRDIAAGSPGLALQALHSHAQRYPRSMLVQEREALTIKALVAAGRSPEARVAADRFAASYPSSMLLDSVKNSVRSIP